MGYFKANLNVTCTGKAAAQNFLQPPNIGRYSMNGDVVRFLQAMVEALPEDQAGITPPTFRLVATGNTGDGFQFQVGPT